MKLRKALWLSGGGLALISALYAGASLEPELNDRLSSSPRPFRVYSSLEPFDDIELPLDYREQTEWVQARLMYPPHPQGRFSRPMRYRRQSRLARRRHQLVAGLSARRPALCQALRRLTRVHVRSVEQPVNPDDGDDVFNWPWLVAGEMGDWKLTEAQAAQSFASTCCAAAS